MSGYYNYTHPSFFTNNMVARDANLSTRVGTLGQPGLDAGWLNGGYRHVDQVLRGLPQSGTLFQGSPTAYNLAEVPALSSAQGPYWTNVYNAGTARGETGRAQAKTDALTDIRQALARKGLLGSSVEQDLTRRVNARDTAYDPTSYGKQALDYFKNLLDSDYQKWETLRLSPEYTQMLGSATSTYLNGPGANLPGVSWKQPLFQTSNVGDYSVFNGLSTDASENYNSSMNFANNLAPDWANYYKATVGLATKGAPAPGQSNKGGAGAGAYFGPIQQASGLQEFQPNQEFANVFGNQTTDKYVGRGV